MVLTRLSYVYLTYMVRISYVIDSGKIKVSHYFHIKKCVDTTNMGGRTYPVRYYPVAIRLRDRNSTPHQFTKLVGDPVGRAILCIALFPQSGDSSGAILGVRSVALLHVIDSGKAGIGCGGKIIMDDNSLFREIILHFCVMVSTNLHISKKSCNFVAIFDY